MFKKKSAGMLSYQSGFTLVEVLVALVILSLAFSAIMVSLSQSNRSLQFIQKKTAANWVAANIAAEARLGLLNLGTGASSESGQQYMWDREWRWNLRTLSTENPYVREMEIEVIDPETNRPILSLTSYMAGNPNE